MPPPRLWSWHRSPFAAKVRVVCAEKGIDVDLLEIDPQRRPARLRELNPTARVPVLELDAAAIFESSAICEWLEETRPEPPLWPQDPLARATARGVMRWVDDQLTASFFLAVRKEALGIGPTDHPEVVAHLRERLVGNWPLLETLLGRTEGPWLAGGVEPTLADLSAMALAVRLPEWRPDLGPDPGDHPRAVAWLARLRERPSSAEVSRKGRPVGEAAAH